MSSHTRGVIRSSDAVEYTFRNRIAAAAHEADSKGIAGDARKAYINQAGTAARQEMDVGLSQIK